LNSPAGQRREIPTPADTPVEGGSSRTRRGPDDRGLRGKWRIVETELWDQDALDLIEPAFIEFRLDRTGSFAFIAVEGWLDCRPASIEGRLGVEFTWDGRDENDTASGRGWAALLQDGTLEGHIYFHMADDSSFRARPFVS
jgi:hypothetical protein